MKKIDCVIKGAAQVLTCGDGLGMLHNACVGIDGGKIAYVGRECDCPPAERTVDAHGCCVLPGFVDCHTHLVFGGMRLEEYVASLSGMARSEMAQQGIPFGLPASMAETAAESDHQLLAGTLQKLRNMLRAGTTTAEVKSGYGLETGAELRQLRTIREAAKLQPVTLVPTFLGAHAWPPDMAKSRYLDLLVQEMIPAVAAEGIAVFCDIWCDDGYYTAAECERVLTRALEFGMQPKIHTDAYSYIGGSDLAAEMQMCSADHLNFTPKAALYKLAKAGVVGVLLPGTDFCVNHPRPFAPGPMLEAGLKTALGTNLNPGCFMESMRTVMILACRRHGMSPKTALLSATLHAAMALGMQDSIGSLTVGKQADIQIWDTHDFRTGIYMLDRNPVRMVLKQGVAVVGEEEE